MTTQNTAPTFTAGDGIVMVDPGSHGYSVTVQADGKILVAGHRYISGSPEFALTRYNSNGSLDTTFDTDGIVTTRVGAYSYGQSVTVQADGKILVAGTSSTSSIYDSSYGKFVALTRYNSNGSLDNTFDTDGIVTTRVGSNSTGQSVTVQADGKILVAGTSSYSSSDQFATLTRYNSNGSLDTTFDTDGIVTTQVDSGSYGYSVTVQADGKILVAGSGSGLGSPEFALTRYNSNGSLDTTFDAKDTVNTETNMAVVMLPLATITDAELSAQGNYNNAHLSLQRLGAANVNDVFGTSDPISFANGVLSYSGTSIGTVTQNNGKLDLTFNSNAIPSAVTTTLRSLTYTNVGTGTSEKITLDWTFSDGNTGSQGDGGVGTVTGSSVVNITDLTPPYVNNFIPNQGATNVALNSDIVLIFNESIQRGTGNIVLKNSLGTVIATYDAASSSNLSFTGNTLTINPSSDLAFSTRYSVELADGTLKDLSGNPYPYAGNYFKASYYEFTTAAPNSLPTGSVTITGTVEQNQTLSVNNSLADANGLGTISYQWMNAGTPISGANQETYTLTAADVGKAISVQASYTDLQGTAESVTSTATALVTLPINYPPTGSVIISGTASQNQTLTASNTLVDANDSGTVSYQWLRDGVTITSANQATYALTQKRTWVKTLVYLRVTLTD